MSTAPGMEEFFGQIAAYYRVRGWAKPGTREQFHQAVHECWGLEVVTVDGTEELLLPAELSAKMGQWADKYGIKRVES